MSILISTRHSKNVSVIHYLLAHNAHYERNTLEGFTVELHIRAQFDSETHKHNFLQLINEFNFVIYSTERCRCDELEASQKATR